MQEVDRSSVDQGAVLRDVVELGFGFAPVEFVEPVVDQLAQISTGDASVPIVGGERLGKPGTSETLV